jgi:hypothetical protein
LPFRPSSFYMLFRLFPHFLYPHRPKDFFFSFFFLLLFFLLHKLRGSILCHATEQRIANEKKERKKMSLLLLLSLYAFISIDFFLFM